MNVKELKQEIMNLAFEEPVAMQEYSDIVDEAISRAILEISATVRPILGKVEIEQIADKGEDGQGRQGPGAYRRYKLSALAEDFLSPVNKVTLESKGRYIDTVDYKMEGQTVILLPAAETGLFTVWYQRKPAKVTADTLPTDELELDEDLHILMPLLASFYVWLDDDERKAMIYYNRYEDLKAQLLARTAERPAAVIEGGLRW